MTAPYFDLMFTPAVVEAQEKYFGKKLPTMTPLSKTDMTNPKERDYIATRDSFYLATVTETGWPYVQHRGGKPGFLKVIDPQTLVFPDYRGNRQLLSVGNLSVNDRASLFLMDYPSKRRLKLLGHIRVENAKEHPELVQEFANLDPQKTIERIFFIKVVAHDWNCPQYITPRYTAAEIEGLVAPLKSRITELEAQLNGLKATGESSSVNGQPSA